MSRVNRSVAALLLLAVLFSLAACGSSEPKQIASATTAPAAEPTTAETTEPPLSDDLPEMDFKGASVTIINSTTTSGMHYTPRSSS